MDAEKVTEVEMKAITPEDKDAEKGKVEETKADQGANVKEDKKEKDVKEEESKAEKGAKGKEDNKEKDVKEEESSVYCKLKSPTEDIYNTSLPSSSSKNIEEAEKGAKGKEDNKEKKEEESSVYCKLESKTEDIYNTSVPSTSSKNKEEVEIKVEDEGEKKDKETEEESNVYSKLKSPTEDIYNPSMPSSSSKRYKEKEGKKEENEEVEDVYCKLNDPGENVYMTTMSSSTAKHNKDIYRRLHLYKKIAAFFFVLSLLLLAVVLALAMKSYAKCPEIAEPNCELCQTKCPPLKGIQECKCSECAEDWEMFENSCYFFSDDRLKWQESREACQKLGGDLVVIDNERVQKFLTEDRNIMYWIGFHYLEDQTWMWINNSTTTRSFWSNGQPKPDGQGSCALLNGGTSDLNNWLSNSCNVMSQYICRKC
ncbi:CD209 antigen-like protein D [Tachysurus fulvidraco]|uniref:CD209 antigen-like protein D n=1 Tax=Tachysurus fulvidraco TaxID=1234273 RepID=UPI001FF03210|nr:CD209 antigen-like protein D [Tachysurus fulvidraco]